MDKAFGLHNLGWAHLLVSYDGATVSTTVVLKIAGQKSILQVQFNQFQVLGSRMTIGFI